nr:MAG TPA: hypothetical protein [Caudoviricetes sp.]
MFYKGKKRYIRPFIECAYMLSYQIIVLLL